MPTTSWPARTGALAAALALAVALPVPLAAAPADGDSASDFDAASGRAFKKRQKRPIKLGTSGGNDNDFEIEGNTIFCGSGTLGGLVEKNGRFFVLSNNHVLAMLNKAAKGDPVSQPGLIDDDCEFDDPGDVVATLSGWRKLKFGGRKKNFADVAIAEVLDGTVTAGSAGAVAAVDLSGEILKLGVPGDQVLPPAVGMKVQKVGRSTGRTRGEICTIGADIEVGFGDGKAGRFVNQIIVEPAKKDFVIGGDSGAMLYADESPCPHAVGLVFAGGGGFGVASPMARALTEIGKIRPKGEARLVGCTPSLATAARLAAGQEIELQAARRLQRRSRNVVLDIPGVVGMGVGYRERGSTEVALHVLVERDDERIRALVPQRIGRFPVRIIETGRFHALAFLPEGR